MNLIKPSANHPVLEANMYFKYLSVCICICIGCNLELYPLQRLQIGHQPYPHGPLLHQEAAPPKDKNHRHLMLRQIIKLIHLRQTYIRYTCTLRESCGNIHPVSNAQTALQTCATCACSRMYVCVCARALNDCLRLNHNLVGLVNGCLCSFLCCCLCSCLCSCWL